MVAIAVALGFRVEVVPDLGGPHGILVGRVIVLSAMGCHWHWSFVIAHELAHAAAERDRLPQGEHEMDAIAGALLAPIVDLALARAGETTSLRWVRSLPGTLRRHRLRCLTNSR